MAPPLIHIGYHRTGTTWFQERFYPAVANGFLVPRKTARAAIIQPAAFAFSVAEARRELGPDDRPGRLLICEENLSGYLHNGGLNGLVSKEVAGRLHQLFPEASLVVFLRSQPRMVEAAYAQYVKGGGTHSIETYVRGNSKGGGIRRHWYKAPRFTLDHFRYAPLLDHYASLFGRRDVHVYLYEQFAADPRAFCAAFAAEHGLTVDLERIDWGRLNPSLAPRQTRILRRLNLFTKRSVPDKRFILDIDDWYERRWRWLARLDNWVGASEQPLLTDQLRATIADRFRDSNQALAEAWGLPLGQYGYPLTEGTSAA